MTPLKSCDLGPLVRFCTTIGQDSFSDACGYFLSYFQILVEKQKLRWFGLWLSEGDPSSTMQNVIGPIRISHLYRTFFFIYSWPYSRCQPVKNTSTSMLRDYGDPTLCQWNEKGRRGRQKKTLSAQLGQLKTGQGRKGLLRSHLRCPYDLPRLWFTCKFTCRLQIYINVSTGLDQSH